MGSRRLVLVILFLLFFTRILQLHLAIKLFVINYVDNRRICHRIAGLSSSPVSLPYRNFNETYNYDAVCVYFVWMNETTWRLLITYYLSISVDTAWCCVGLFWNRLSTTIGTTPKLIVNRNLIFLLNDRYSTGARFLFFELTLIKTSLCIFLLQVTSLRVLHCLREPRSPSRTNE